MPEVSATLPDKGTIRRDALARRDGIRGGERRTKEARILASICALPEFINARAVLLYASFRSEVDTSLLTAHCREMQKSTVFPRVDITAEALALYAVSGHGLLENGFCGIPEPVVSGTAPVDIRDIDLVIVPGVAFDPHCRRVGYGRGFYDALLRSVRPFSVGVCFEEQMVGCIPYESRDVPMDVVVTDERIIRRYG